MISPWPRLGCACCALIGLVSTLSAAEPARSAEERIAVVAAEAKQFVEKCTITTAGSSPTTFKLHTEPVLRWSNPTAGEVYGDIFLYTQRGRPAAMISYYRWFTPNWGGTVEVCSLHEGPIVGTANSVRFWTPKTPGLKFEPLTDVDPPAPLAAARLTQLRRIADEFGVRLVDTRANDGGVRRSLRRLAQPVYRYPSPTPDSDYIDGALFAFVEGTDPELLLFVEAVTMNTAKNWRFGIARLNRDQIEVTRQDKVIWEAAYLTDPLDKPHDAYTAFSTINGLKPAPSVP